MKGLNYITILSALWLILTTVTSCTLDDSTTINTIELGAVQSEYVVDAQEGFVEVSVYVNKKCDISMSDQLSWAQLETTTLTGDGSFKVAYQANNSFPRMAQVVMSVAGKRQDTVYIKQRGAIEPQMVFENPNTPVNGSRGAVIQTPLISNIDFDKIALKILYANPNEEQWVGGVTYSQGQLEFTVTANPSQSEVRTAQVVLEFTDGWGNLITATLYITQANAKDTFGELSSFEDIRAMCDETASVDIFNSYLINGWVVSDTKGGNMGDNPQTTESTIDYGVCNKTVYLESIDGKYGFMLQTATDQDNLFERYSRVQLSLKGATVTRYDNPERYVISNVKSSMIMSSSIGGAGSIPQKELYITELTDADIYTYVTLKECELPIRKGSLTPINEGYTNATGANRTEKFPLLVRDIKGSSIYLYTNTTCRYRRDGSRLPYGSGCLSGIVVHELYQRFEYMDNDSGDDQTYGNIGRYQLRHVSKSDIALDDDFKNSFSALLTEYRYCVYDNNKIYPTYGKNGYMTHSYSDASGAIKIVTNEDFSYLGPIGNNDAFMFGKNVGNINGLGIILEDGTDWGRDKSEVNSSVKNDSAGAGKGKVPATVGPAWVDWYWWDAVHNRGHAWIVNVSTAGITTDQLSMQVSVLNDRNSSGSGYSGPRYFNVEWSQTGDMDKNSDWKSVGSYTVPDMTQWTPATRYWQCSGFKPINLPLPLEMLGKDNVYIRMQVARNVAGDLNGYANTKISSPSCMNYFAIRYNKK